MHRSHKIKLSLPIDRRLRIPRAIVTGNMREPRTGWHALAHGRAEVSQYVKPEQSCRHYPIPYQRQDQYTTDET